MKKPLYVSRSLLQPCAESLFKWAQGQGITNAVVPEEMHVTVAFSSAPVDWSTLEADQVPVTIAPFSPRSVVMLGPSMAVLEFRSASLQNRFSYFTDRGCSWDFPSYRPHVSIAKPDEGELNVRANSVYTGPLIFGGEVFEDLDVDHKAETAMLYRSSAHRFYLGGPRMTVSTR